MLRQIEGSRAVAETVARCRPHVVAAYPISPQTHIVEAPLRPGALGGAGAVRVPDGRVRVRGALGLHRRLGRRCPRLHGHREPGAALHGRGAAQRLRPRPADRDDGGQPCHRRPDQHLERPLRRHVAARRRLDPAVRGVQPGGGRPARTGLRPRRAAVPPGDGLHGRLRADPRGRGDRRPARTRSTPSSRRSLRGSASTRTSRSPSARWSGPRRSPR